MTRRPLVERIPDELTVWAFSDAHGMTDAVVEALRRARIVDASGHWKATRTALVCLGDTIDRGPDSAGVIDLLRRLGAEAEGTGDGSTVVTLMGNHEQLLLRGLDGDADWWDTWIGNHGGVTLESFGVKSPGGPGALRMDRAAPRLVEAAPWLHEWLDGLPDAARWRDVLLVHAGLIPGKSIAGWPRHDPWENHLWVREEWFDEWKPAGLEHPTFRRYRAVGIDRVVFGHSVHPSITAHHGGTCLAIDTNACEAYPPPYPAALSLVRIPPDPGPFDLAQLKKVVVRTR